MLSVIPAAQLKDLDSGALTVAILDAVGTINPAGTDLISEAIGAATYLHRGQTRANRAGMPRTPYSEHPLRNALRALRQGVTDLDIITAIILHDVIEDCARAIVSEYLDMDTAKMGEQHLRVLAYDWMDAAFGANVTRLVRAVTNPLATGPKQPREVTNLRYANHVQDAIRDNAEVFIVKFVDFVDNAVGLHHNVSGLGAGVNDAMAARLAAKYQPLIHIFEAELASNYGEIMTYVSAEGIDMMISHLASAKNTLPGLQLQAA